MYDTLCLGMQCMERVVWHTLVMKHAVSTLDLTGCCAGMLLKEMIEDLEWTAVGSNNSTVEVCMQRQPRRLLFTAQAAGSLQVRPIRM